MLKVVIAACMLASSVFAQDDVADLMEVENDFLLEQEALGRFNESDFVSPFEMPQNAGDSYLIPELVVNNPIFATLPGSGLGFALIELGPCTVLQPHTHPRATEGAFVLEGSIEMGLNEETGGRPAVINTVEKNQAMVFPQGLVHWQFNNACEPARFLASLNNRDPGVAFVVPGLSAGAPDGVLRAVLGVDSGDLRRYKRSVSDSPFPTDPVCMKRCGMDS